MERATLKRSAKPARMAASGLPIGMHLTLPSGFVEARRSRSSISLKLSPVSNRLIRPIGLMVRWPRACRLPATGAAHEDDAARPTYFWRVFFDAAWPLFTGPMMLKSSSFLPAFSAAASHRGLRPRPAHVSAGLSGLRYFGATAPRMPPRPLLPRDPPAARRSNLLSSS
jgi:hypothetical protein